MALPTARGARPNGARIGMADGQPDGKKKQKCTELKGNISGDSHFSTYARKDMASDLAVSCPKQATVTARHRHAAT